MLVTEEEAKTKWCPHSRYAVSSDPAANRWKQSLPDDEPHALNPIPCRCIASECMAWRWASASRRQDDIPIGDLGLSERSFNGLRFAHKDEYMGIQEVKTAGDVKKLDDRGMLTRIPNIGKRSAAEIRSALADIPRHSETAGVGYCGLSGKPDF